MEEQKRLSHGRQERGRKSEGGAGGKGMRDLASAGSLLL